MSCHKCSKKKNVLKYYHCHCHQKIQLNLSGLTDNLNFQLLSNPKNNIVIQTISPDTNIEGKVYRIGIDYIDVQKKKGEIVTVWKDKIRKIYLLVDVTNLLEVENEDILLMIPKDSE